jgi:Na+/proline symporter
VILYLAGLLVMTFATQAFLGQGIPITGSANLTLPSTMTMGANIIILITSAFQWPFYIAIVAAGLSITARFYHTKLAKAPKQTSQEPITIQTIPLVEREKETPIPITRRNKINTCPKSWG